MGPDMGAGSAFENTVATAYRGFTTGDAGDAFAFSTVVKVLDAVRKAPVDVNQEARDLYEFVLSVVDPNKRMSPDDEALLVTVLRALSEAVSRIDAIFHAALLSNIFKMCLWNYSAEARDALLILITRLAPVADKFLDGCLHMLVTNFIPPDGILKAIDKPKLSAMKSEIHAKLQVALVDIAESVPFAPLKLKDTIDRCMPRPTDSSSRMVAFVECMLHLESGKLGEALGNTIIAKVVDLLTDLDVNISWESIVKEEHRGIFDMEVEDLEDKITEETAEKLDNLMVVVCEHLKSCADEGRLLKEFWMLLEIFPRSVLRLHKSKFSQFVIFYASSLDPKTCGNAFAVLLRNIFCSASEDPVSRMSAVSYLGSYLSRAKFMSPFDVTTILKSLVHWCYEYCLSCCNNGMRLNPQAHQIFYAGCQAVMYILCFRLRAIMDVPNLKLEVLDMPLGFIFFHPLDPLKVCLPSIVQEFQRQASDGRLFDTSSFPVYDNTAESDLSRAFGGNNRLDMFFPFDPYLLRKSDRYMRPCFKFWSMVKTTYSDCDSDDDGDGVEFVDIDVPPEVEDKNIGSFEDHYNLYMHCGDFLEYSMNSVSITPKSSFHHPPSSNSLSQMPARIRPSVSPP